MQKSYKEIEEALDILEYEKFLKPKALIFSIFLALLLVSGPFAIMVNLLIFVDYRKLIYAVMGFLLILFVYVCERTYLKIIAKGRVEGLETIYITDTFVMGFIILVFLLIIFELEVI